MKTCLRHIDKNWTLQSDKLPMDTLRTRMMSLAKVAHAKNIIRELSFQDDRMTLQFMNDVAVITPDPVLYIFDRDFPKQQTVWEQPSVESVADTIFVNSDGQSFPTDFSRLGNGLLHQDFVSLEADLRFNQIETDNLITLYNFEKQLTDVDESY